MYITHSLNVVLKLFSECEVYLDNFVSWKRCLGKKKYFSIQKYMMRLEIVSMMMRGHECTPRTQYLPQRFVRFWRLRQHEVSDYFLWSIMFPVSFQFQVNNHIMFCTQYHCFTVKSWGKSNLPSPKKQIFSNHKKLPKGNLLKGININ